MSKHPVTIYCDGACIGNPGPGGWGALLSYGPHEKRISGGEKDSTNNRMELMAAIESLNALNQPCHVTVFSDSQYVIKGMNEWIHNWKKNNWIGSKGEVKNRELWELLDKAAERHHVTWKWVKGHSGVYGNEEADTLANAEAAKYAQS